MSEPISVKISPQQNILNLCYEDLFIMFWQSLNDFQKILFHLCVLNIHDHILRRIVMRFFDFEQKIIFLNIVLWMIQES